MSAPVSRFVKITYWLELSISASAPSRHRR